MGSPEIHNACYRFASEFNPLGGIAPMRPYSELENGGRFGESELVLPHFQTEHTYLQGIPKEDLQGFCMEISSPILVGSINRCGNRCGAKIPQIHLNIHCTFKLCSRFTTVALYPMSTVEAGMQELECWMDGQTCFRTRSRCMKNFWRRRR